jgi:Domain of unknown function (DUF1844)
VQEEESLPSIDFATFLISLSHSALMHLGHAPHPETQQVEVHLPLAKQTIDLLGLLEMKTKGNLSGDEERLLSQILFELRNKFLSQAAAAPSSARH